MVNIYRSVERNLDAASSAVYPAKCGVDGGVEPGNQSTPKGSVGEVSSSAYLIGSDKKWGQMQGSLDSRGSNAHGRRYGIIL